MHTLLDSGLDGPEAVAGPNFSGDAASALEAMEFLRGGAELPQLVDGCACR